MEIEDINAAITIFGMEKGIWTNEFPEFFHIGAQKLLIQTTNEKTFNIYRNGDKKYEKLFANNIPFYHAWSFEDKVDGFGMVFLLTCRSKWIVIQKDIFLIEYPIFWINIKDINITPIGRVGFRELRIGNSYKYIRINRRTKSVKFIEGGNGRDIIHRVISPASSK